MRLRKPPGRRDSVQLSQLGERHQADGRGDGLRRERAGDPREIALLEIAIAKRALQRRRRLRGRKDHEPRRSTTQAVHGRPVLGLLGAHPCEQRVHEKPAAGHGGEARRLVDDQHMLVFVHGGEVQRHLGLGPGRARPDQRLPRAQYRFRPRRRIVQQQPPGFEMRSPLLARRVRVLALEPVEQRHSARARGKDVAVDEAFVQLHGETGPKTGKN